MTLIVGVRCQDGVVIGADTISTYISPRGAPTIEQEVESKIDILDDALIIATAGSVGTSQLIKARLERDWTTIDHDQPLVDVRSALSESIWQQVKPTYRRVGDARYLLRDERIAPDACFPLMAFSLSDTPTLLQFDQYANSTEYTPSLPFVSLGSGQAYADPFLAFLKRAIWQNSAPKRVADGITGILWALQHVNQVGAGIGVGGEPSIVVLHKPESNWVAERLTHDRVDAHRQLIMGAEFALQDFLQATEPVPELMPIPLPTIPDPD